MERKRFDCYGICVPAAALIAAVGGAQSAAMKLMAAGWLAGLITLGAADALRRAAGGMISRRKLLGAWLFSLLLAALTAAAGVLGAPWLAGRLAMGAVEVKWWLSAAAALVGLRCTVELFAAQGDIVSARLSDGLAGIALAAAMLIYIDDPDRARACGCCAIGVLTLSVGIAAFFGKGERPQLTVAALRETPAAWVRELLYPLAMLGWAVLVPEKAPRAEDLAAGWLLASLCRTSFRRSRAESTTFNAVIGLAALLTGGALAALQLSGCAIPVMPFIAVWMALCCGMALYGAISPGNIVAWIAMAAALAGSAAADRLNCCTALPWTGLVLAAGGLIAAGCSVPDWLLIFRRARAARIRRRASKGRSLR